MHGIGVIEAIETQTILGEQKEYYILRFAFGSMTAMVPVRMAEQVGVRFLADLNMCDRVEEYLLSGETPEGSDNWNQRYHDNLEKLRTGDLLAEAQVVKSLAERDRRKGLSTGERKMYLSSRKVLLAEMSEITGKDESYFASIIDA